MSAFSVSALPPIFIAGPTAAGKSAVAVILADLCHGEIISVDSMQVYRGLDIGTAKPSLADRRRVPHHLIDVVELTGTFDAAKFVLLARRALSEIQARGRQAIFCGGTGLYFKAFLEGLGETPPADAALRAQLEATPLPELLRELAERDPVTFQKIDRQNPRRIIRAVEVIRQTARPMSEQIAPWQEAHAGAANATVLPKATAGFLLGLTRSPDDLRRRIETRVDEMFERGLVQETERLLPQGLAQNRTALQALGYRQVTEYLQGVRSLPETIALVKQRTRQFAKRQKTWFKWQMKLTWLELQPHDNPEAVAERVARSCGPGADGYIGGTRF
ncbi:MAG: tRNA (adenosine(37)-N6)-dimethylallyltransferase MiaA [Verrucomicrobiota bacterium]